MLLGLPSHDKQRPHQEPFFMPLALAVHKFAWILSPVPQTRWRVHQTIDHQHVTNVLKSRALHARQVGLLAVRT